MKTSNAMTMLHELAQKECDKAAQQLGNTRHAAKQAEDQLTMLLNYQAEYRNQLNSGLALGMASIRWHNYHQFIQTLGKAIEQHRQQLNQWQLRFEKALVHWRNKRQRVHACETLLARASACQQLQENRLDQQQNDEFAQRAQWRKGE